MTKIGELLNEMARVGTFGKFEIRIYPEPLGNPSFHLIKRDEYEVVLQIKDYRILEWKFNKKNIKDIPNSDLWDVKSYLGSSHELGITNWQYLIATWNSNNPKFKIELPKK